MEATRPGRSRDRRSRRNLTFETPRLTALRAQGADAPRLQACLQGAPGYFDLTEGQLPASNAAEELLADAEADPDRRVYVLVRRQEKAARGPAVGVLDLHLDYPEPGTAQVGLLLLREAWQGQGFGRETMTALEEALRQAGYRAIRLSVVDRNVHAQLFWQQLGFAEVGRLATGVTAYEKPLGQP